MSANKKSYMPQRRLAQQWAIFSDLEWPFHASRAISAVAELLVLYLLDGTKCHENNDVIRRLKYHQARSQNFVSGSRGRRRGGVCRDRKPRGTLFWIFFHRNAIFWCIFMLRGTEFRPIYL